MLFNTLIKVTCLINKVSFLPLFLLIGSFCWAQNGLEQKSFEFLSNYLEHHKSTDTLYFEYVKAYENKAQITGDLEKMFYAKSEYIVHGTMFSEKLKHAQQFLQIAQEQNNTLYTGLAYNKIALVYYMERDLEQSLHYELLAEELLSQTNDLYNLNKSRFGIGNIYYFLGDYEKALSFFNKAAAYYKSQKEYNDLNGYLSSIRYIGKCYYNLLKYKEVDTILKQAVEQAPYLKNHHQELNNAYFSLLRGQNLWAQKKYEESLAHLQKILPVIAANDDFANEHLVYLYIGKNLWALHKQVEALEQFKKVDQLFTTKQYSDLNLLEAYDYLIALNKSNNDLKNQLFYTERLLKVTNELQAQNKGLSNVLHNKYETKKLEANRKELQTKLTAQKQKGYFLYGFAISLVIGFLCYIIYTRKKQKAVRKQYEYFVKKQVLLELNAEPLIIDNVAKEEIVINNKLVIEEKEAEEKVTINIEEEQKDKAVQKADKKALADDKVQEILQKLNDFEKKRGYINKEINLNTLAKEFNTNVKYLSEVINSVKNENFSNYINRLRVEYAVLQLHKKNHFRKQTINALAEKFGFSSTRSFSDAFFKVTGLKPSYYISQIEKDEKAA